MNWARINLFVVCFVFSSVVCAEQIDYAQLLVGKWGYLQKEDGSYWGYDEYFADGTVHAWGTNPDTQQSWEIWGTVELVDNVSCSTTTKSSDPNLIPVGIKVCDEIVAIDETSIIWKHQDGNMTEVEKIID